MAIGQVQALAGLFFGALIGAAAPFEADAQAKPPLGVAPPPPKPEYERPQWWDDDEHAVPPRRSWPPRDPRQATRKPPVQPKTEPAKPGSPWTAPPRDEALARCDTLRQRFEQVIRAEMRGNDPATAQRLKAERQSIYEQQVRAGC
ncbi:MAG TPA: hypothetical protein VIV54_22895 [Burkholderiales bacterium]